MDELKWNWVYIPYLDAPEIQAESALKAGYTKVYFKSDVDKTIAELKDKCQMHNFFWEGCGLEKRGFKNAIAVAQYVEDLEAKLRATRRALWLAREWRAWCEGQFWLAIPSDKPRDIYHLFMTNRIHRTPAEWMAYWHKVEQLCKKKAEEYK